MDLSYIKAKIKKCIDEFYLNDFDLLNRENHEVTISCKFSQYLQKEFSKYDVDAEYNKHLDGKKLNDELKQEVRPDIIIHKRGTDKNNLVYIEIKTDHNTDSRDADLNKIKSMTKQDGEYKYKLGVFIDFNRDKKNLVVKFFENGEEIR